MAQLFEMHRQRPLDTSSSRVPFDDSKLYDEEYYVEEDRHFDCVIDKMQRDIDHYYD